MSFKEIMFSFNGRLNRSAYFGYSVLALTAFGIVICVGVGLCFTKEATGVILGALVMLVGLPVTIWSIWALFVKRLHDLDLSGLHAIWFYMLGIAPTALATASPALAAICGLAQFGISLYFLFAPGTPDQNRFGRPRFANTSVGVAPAMA